MTSQESRAPSPAMSSRRTPHVLLVSLPLQGHVNPLLVLGRRLASRGILVTFTTVPHAGLKKLDETDVGCGGALRFEHLSGAGLWAPDDPRFRAPDDMARHLDDAAPAALAGLIRRQAEPVTCVVANAFAPWALRAAGAAGVPGAMLWTQSCAVLSLHYHYFRSPASFPTREDGTVVFPGLPPLSPADLPSQIHSPEEFVWRRMLVADMRGLRETAPWVLVNTFDELERAPIEALRAHLPDVLPVGPLFEPDPDTDDTHDECMVWLDAQPPRSVVYAAFGSLVQHSREETAELAAGLAATGHPFHWVVRDDTRHHLPPDYHLVPATVGDSSRGQGKVVPWCRQRHVLSHPAVGCFVTHCGWNSATEALAAGVPVVAYPAWSDQPTNAKLLVDAYGVGVRLPAPLTSDGLRRCVEEVMSGPAAEAVRTRAGEWKAKAGAAVAAGGSSDRGVQDFVDAVMSMQ